MTDVTIGLDVSDRFTHGCVLDASGTCLEEFRVRTTAAALEEKLAGVSRARVVIEAGTHSPWMSRVLGALGHQVVVAHASRVALIAKGDRKSDRSDAEQLARLGRVDPTLLCPVEHRSEGAQKDLMLLRVRDGLVRARTQLISQARGLTKVLGARLPRCSARGFARRMRAVSADLFPGFGELVSSIEVLTEHIRTLDRRIEELSHTAYPVAGTLQQVPGVGPITALGFVLTIDDPHRFANSRKVGAYLGLRPRQRDSGDRSPTLGITKAGDPFLRKVLVQAAQHALGPFGPDTDLRRYGLRIVQQGGRAAKKRAVIAVARKLSVLLHRLWITGKRYQALGYTVNAAV
ncbi:MAG TPA: IS110 family transposase [Solirubrobacteraceae bacterium]|jgi:transposase|nr:IS110 family transposase [Solirubrobacteraceae bacterium]